MPQQTRLPTASLKPDPNQPRKSRDPVKQRQLNESVKVHGVLQPVGVRPDRVTLVWGEGRWLAAREAGLKDIPAIILDEPKSEGEYTVLQLVENTLHSGLSDFDQWQGCADILRTNPQWQLKDLATMLSLDPSSLTRILSPSKCIPAAVEALREGKIGFAHTYTISKAGSPEEQARLLALALEGKSRAVLEAERASHTSRNSGKAAVRVQRVKCMLPSGIVIVVSGEGLSLDDLIEALAEAQKEAKKAREQGLDAKTLQAVMRDRAKAR